ncbi:MAG: hypothetical protein VB046_07665 [Paludibacter sp.]|nr:hypothetical protein [Paludibacter sp.]
MKSLRQRISLLRKRVNESFSNENDIFGYAGISKTLILESLKESYDSLSVLEVYNDKFETILAKRNVAQFIDSSNSYLTNYFGTDSEVEKFNEFLNNVSQIRFCLKEAYISLSEKPLRLDAEVQIARNDLNSLKQDIQEITEIKEKIDKIKVSSYEFLVDLEAKFTKATENDKIISEIAKNVVEHDTQFRSNIEKISVWKSEIQSVKEDISNKQVEISKLRTEVEQIQKKNIDQQTLAEKIAKTLNEQLSTNKNQQEYIQQTIEDVSRAGMAGSFKKRKDELKFTQFVWAALTIISVGGLVWLSYNVVKPLLEGQGFPIEQLYFKIPVIASAVWLGWFCSKQYGFTTRIREDYSYKYAISLAFEGYKNEAREIDEELLQHLIKLTIFNISKSPVTIFDTKNNHGTPYNEMFDNLTKRFFANRNTPAEEE